MPSRLLIRDVNWVEGMKVHREHFSQVHRYIDDRTRDVLAVDNSRWSYGLLEPVVGLEVLPLVSDGEQKLTLRLVSCNGFSRGGFRILIPWGESDTQRLENTQARLVAGKDCYVVVRSGEDVLPSGEIADEVPRRQKDVVPQYTLEIYPHDLVMADERCIPIAKLADSRGTCDLDRNYIPPCVSIDAHPSLTEFAADALNRCKEMMENAASVARREAERTTRDKHLVELARLVANSLACRFDTFAMCYHDLAPINICALILPLARSMSVMFASLPEKTERTDLRRALQARGGFDTEVYQRLEERLFESSAAASHSDIMRCLDPMREYLRYLANIFQALERGKERGFIIK